MSIPSVFISYSHDSPEHSEWVRRLATDLRKSGVDAFLDVWDLKPGDNFVEKIQGAVQSADYYIVVCTPRYREVAEKRRSSGGAGYELELIRNWSIHQEDKSKRCLPLVRSGQGREALPDWLIDRSFLDCRDNRHYQEQLHELLQAILLVKRKEHPKLDKKATTDAPTKNKVTLLIDGLDEVKIGQLRDILDDYLGPGVTISEVKHD